jgi:hypothetical protein
MLWNYNVGKILEIVGKIVKYYLLWKNALIADGQLVGVVVVGPDVFGLDNGLDLGPHSRRVCRWAECWETGHVRVLLADVPDARTGPDDEVIAAALSFPPPPRF